MKKYLILILFVAFNIVAFSQTVSLKRVTGSNEFDGINTLKLDKPRIKIEDVTINCRNLIITQKVKRITLIGDTKIICDSVTIGDKNKSITVKIKSRGGSLTVEYKSNFTDNSSTFFIKRLNGVGLKFKKVSE